MTRQKLDDALNEFLRDDENFKTYIDVAFSEYLDGETDNLILIIRHLIDKKGVSSVVEETGVSRAALYRSFCKGGNPTFKSLKKVLSSVGYELTIRPARPNA